MGEMEMPEVDPRIEGDQRQRPADAGVEPTGAEWRHVHAFMQPRKQEYDLDAVHQHGGQQPPAAAREENQIAARSQPEDFARQHRECRSICASRERAHVLARQQVAGSEGLFHCCDCREEARRAQLPTTGFAAGATN
jgi:hypothetical protein